MRREKKKILRKFETFQKHVLQSKNVYFRTWDEIIMIRLSTPPNHFSSDTKQIALNKTCCLCIRKKQRKR